MNKPQYFLSLVFILFVIQPFAGSTNRYAPDLPEAGSIEAISRDTTDPRYVSEWVSYVPESQSVPSPSDFLGHIAGAAGHLAGTRQVYEYFRELDRTSPRVSVEVIGQTEEGREILLVAVADEEGIANLQQLKAATAALADPRKTSPEQAHNIIQHARPMYYFNAAIHADESISPDMMIELAYRLAVSDQPLIQRIRRNLIVLINPVSNPDGRDKMVDWFNAYLKGKTDYDNLPRQSPPYWGKYVYVDANRDAHQVALTSTQAVHRMFFEFHPTVVHDLHEAIPLLQTWNGTGPYNPYLDPIVLTEFLEMSFHEMSTMSSLGMPGVWTWDFGEGFGHHYTDSIGMNHNAIGRGYETFGNTTAETVSRKLDPSDLTRKWYRPSPPPERTFLWSHRDGVNYSQTGCLAILDYAARNADQLLQNFYQKGFNSWQKGKAGNPYAFVIPSDQRDRLRTSQMINLLMKQGIEAHRSTKSFSLNGRTFAAGAFVVKLDQPYRNYAVDLLLPQEFPSDEENQPYDDVSWAFPVHFGVETIRVDDQRILEMPLEPVEKEVHFTGQLQGNGPHYLLRDTGQEALLAARYRLSKFELHIAEKSFRINGIDYPAGSWLIPNQAGVRETLIDIAKDLSLDFASAAAMPEVLKHAGDLPRLGVYVPWADTDSIGWIRLILDRQQIPYVYLRDEEIRAGKLKDVVDVIVYGNVLMDLQGQIHGIERKEGPMPFKKSEQTPSHGTPAESDDITGGIGWSGLANLHEFMNEGGALITLGRGSTLALESGLIRNVQRHEMEGVSTPGAEVVAKFTQSDHPIAYGYPPVVSAFRSNYGIYDPPRTWLTMSYCTSCLSGPFDPRAVVLQWGTAEFQSAEESEPMIVSGGGRNVGALQGRPAILDFRIGKGRAIIFNFNPMHRDLNRSDYRFLWNSILNWNDKM